MHRVRIAGVKSAWVLDDVIKTCTVITYFSSDEQKALTLSYWKEEGQGDFLHLHWNVSRYKVWLQILWDDFLHFPPQLVCLCCFNITLSIQFNNKKSFHWSINQKMHKWENIIDGLLQSEHKLGMKSRNKILTKTQSAPLCPS